MFFCSLLCSVGKLLFECFNFCLHVGDGVCGSGQLCLHRYVKAARVAAWKGGGVELRHWGMNWNGELRLGIDRGMRAGCWSTGIGEGVDGLIADVSVTPTS